MHTFFTAVVEAAGVVPRMTTDLELVLGNPFDGAPFLVFIRTQYGLQDIMVNA